MQKACTFSAGVLPAQVRRTGLCSGRLPMVCAAILALSLSGCSKIESVLYSGRSQKTARDAYRAVTAEDGLQCGYTSRELSIQYVLDSGNRPRPLPSGTLLEFHCANPNGVFIDLELTSYQMDQGKIETRQFGTIRTDGSPFTEQVPQLYMTEDQIVRLKEFLRSKK
ncbi:MAG: hypothetical protein ACRD19_10945 [Terriglobia bacterium]